MSAQAWVLLCALDLLGRSADRFPHIKVVETPPVGVSASAQGFVDRREGVIYLIASAPAFRLAESSHYTPGRRGQCFERVALKMVASIIVHEDWHLKHGADEKSAYEAQLTQLNLLGLGPDTTASQSVTRAMLVVLKARSREQRALQLVSLAR